jgi:PAS domain S-box-containing protein
MDAEEGGVASNDMSVIDAGRSLAADPLGAVIALIPDAAVVVNSDGLIVSANALAEGLFGYKRGALAGLSIETLVPERFRRRHREHRTEFLAAPQVRPMGVGLELFGRRGDGQEFPVDISLAPVVEVGERLIVATIRDITQQRQAMAAQGELATIVRSSLDAIISTTVEGTVLSWNPAAEELFGYDADAIIGKHISLLVPGQASTVFEELLDAARLGERIGARDTRWRHRDGHEIDIALTISPLKDSNRKIQGFSSVVRDITERKAAEQELRRLLREEERLERQHAATAEIRLALLSGTTLEDCLMLICRQASELADAPTSAIWEETGGSLRAVASIGPPAAGGPLPTLQFLAETVIARAEPIELSHQNEVIEAEIAMSAPGGSSLGLPVIVAGRAQAALTLARADDPEGFEPGARAFAESLAAQAALAFELERARQQREQMMLVSDRERIARDLHDHVIQRLFATGIGLQGSLSLIDAPLAQEKVSGAIDALDDTIREIRSAIFALSSLHQGGDRRLRSQVTQLVYEARPVLGFEPSVVFDGPVDAAVPDDVIPHVLACVREALSNAARHSQATAVTVNIRAAGNALTVEVTDNGIGIGTRTRSSGLSNLEERARLLGGTLDVTSPPGGGTCLTWTVDFGHSSR